MATRLVERVSDAVGESVPSGKTVVFTVTAPIRLPSKTAAALEEEIRSALGSRAARVQRKAVIHGNEVRIWVVAGKRQASNVIGLVHNPGATGADLLAKALSLPDADRA